MTERARHILGDYGGQHPGTLTTLALLLNHGRLAGTGRLVILPVDQGFEHGPGRSVAVNPPAYHPHYHFELALARTVLARRDIPLLCICRGMEILNVATGGTLHAHIPDRFGESVIHRLPPHRPARPAVRVEPASRVAEILGATAVEVCSWHHQAVDRLGRDMRAVAAAADGVVEAVEHTAHPWCIGVQWHPEMQLDEAPQRNLFAALVRAALTAGAVRGSRP